MFFFYLFIFASLVLGNFKVGPFSVRVYVTVAMVIYLLLWGRSSRYDKSKVSNTIVRLLTMYLILSALSLYMCGEFAESGFLKSFFSLYLNCYVTYIAFNRFIKTPQQLYSTVIFLISVIAFNCFVTILQYMGNPLGIGVALGLINDPEVRAEILTDQALSATTMFGKDLTIGIFNFSFINANYIAIVGLMLFGVWESSRRKIIKVLFLSLFVLFVIASFVTQSRTPFFLLLLCSFFLVLKGLLKKKTGIIITIVFILFLILLIPLVIESLDAGRLFESSNYENDPRLKIWVSCIDFIGKHLMWGGPVLFEKTYNVAPHNYFLGAFISSGFMGGVLASYMYIRIVVQSLKVFLKKHSLMLCSLSGAVLIYSAGSLFHNASITSGDTMFFVVYCLMLKSQIFEKNNNYFLLIKK